MAQRAKVYTVLPLAGVATHLNRYEGVVLDDAARESSREPRNRDKSSATDRRLGGTLPPGTMMTGNRCAAVFCARSIGLDWVLCHEHRRSKRRCATALETKEGPLGSAIRSSIPSTASGCGQKPRSGLHCSAEATGQLTPSCCVRRLQVQIFRYATSHSIGSPSIVSTTRSSLSTFAPGVIPKYDATSLVADTMLMRSEARPPTRRNAAQLYYVGNVAAIGDQAREAI